MSGGGPAVLRSGNNSDFTLVMITSPLYFCTSQQPLRGVFLRIFMCGTLIFGCFFVSLYSSLLTPTGHVYNQTFVYPSFQLLLSALGLFEFDLIFRSEPYSYA